MRTFICLMLSLCSTAAFAQEAARPAAEPVFPSDLRVERNVAFLAEGRKEKADLYFPAPSSGRRLTGAIVHIHGGGFTGGSRDSKREINICANLARHGYLAMSIDYRLATRQRGSWPQSLQDCKTAVRWLRANAQRLNIDSERIGVIGGSAGATLAALVALTTPDDGLDAKEPYGEYSSQVRCGVVFYGISDLAKWHDTPLLGKTIAEAPELYRQASPVTYARAKSPPLLIVHGTADDTVPHAQSEMLAAALEKAGAAPQLVIIPGAPHTFHLQPSQRDLRPLVFGFFDQHLAP